MRRTLSAPRALLRSLVAAVVALALLSVGGFAFAALTAVPEPDCTSVSSFSPTSGPSSRGGVVTTQFECVDQAQPTVTATATETATVTTTAALVTSTVTSTVTAPPVTVTKTTTATVAATPSSTTTAPPAAAVPLGVPGAWTAAFADEFNGTTLDTGKWSDCSWAESDACHGNKGNQQLEWNQAANCTVTGGQLTMTARRENHTSASGQVYGWTSCLITSTPSFSFQYGYMEERAKLPAARGFWPAFWTWQAPGVNSWIETDGYEFYSDNHTRLYLTQHSGTRGGCTWTPPFDPSAGFHVYGTDVEPSGTTWYVDGVKVCQVAGTSTGRTNLIDNLAVYATVPPDAATTSATKSVDYVRAWRH